MARNYRYSLASKDAKIAGVCAALGRRLGIDPTFIRIAWVAVPFVTPIDFSTALIAYAVVGIVLAVQRRREIDKGGRSDFERMGEVFSRRPSTHAMVNELDSNDRRMMAIDHHLNTTNHELAREIEALREEK